MRRVFVFALLILAGCSEAFTTKVDSRTYAIEGPGGPAGRAGRNQREAQRLCPKGYRVLNEEVHRDTTDRANDENGIFTNWTIRCL